MPTWRGPTTATTGNDVARGAAQWPDLSQSTWFDDFALKSMICQAENQTTGERPALVLSPDLINHHSPVILVVALTSRKCERVYPLEALVEPPEGGPEHRSKVLLMQLRSIDKRRVAGIMGRVSRGTMLRVEEAHQIATGLTPTPTFPKDST